MKWNADANVCGIFITHKISLYSFTNLHKLLSVKN